MRCTKMQVNIMSFHQNVVNWRTNPLCKYDENQVLTAHHLPIWSDVCIKLDLLFLLTWVTFCRIYK